MVVGFSYLEAVIMQQPEYQRNVSTPLASRSDGRYITDNLVPSKVLSTW